MPNPIPPDKVNYQKHEQSAANQHGNCDLQAKLQVTKIGNPPDYVRTEAADQLGGKHVDADGSSVSALRSEIVNHRCDRAVIPRHEEARDEESSQEQPLLLGLYRQ